MKILNDVQYMGGLVQLLNIATSFVQTKVLHELQGKQGIILMFFKFDIRSLRLAKQNPFIIIMRFFFLCGIFSLPIWKHANSLSPNVLRSMSELVGSVEIHKHSRNMGNGYVKTYVEHPKMKRNK